VRGVHGPLTRAQLFFSGVRGGAALLVTGSVFGALADTSTAAPPSGAPGVVPAGDLAYARMLIGVELLAIDFYTNAIASKHLRSGTLDDARVALINETEHYAYLANVLTAVGQTALTGADVNFSYPAGSFYSAEAVTGLAVILELLSLGAYLGTAGNLTNAVLQSAVAQITANEAQHFAAFASRSGDPAFHDAFPGALTIAEASDALATYTS
jgi:Ferritin-like domain